MKRIVVVAVVFLALAGIVGYVLGPGGSLLDRAGSGGDWVEPGGAPAVLDEAVGFVGVEESKAAESVGTVGAISDIGAVPAIGPAVIKTGELTLVVPEGNDSFMQAFDEAVAVAGKYGGYVQSSSTSGREHLSGTLVIRVPATRFEDALADLSALGEPTRRAISGEDVTSTFVDLEARLRSWQAQEMVLLKLMRKARTIEETIRVQQHLQDVRFRIEEIQGQLRFLRDQTELATIMLSMRERGAPVAEGPKAERPSIAEAWQLALNGVLGVAYAVIVGLGYLLPLAALLIVVWLGLRRIRPRPAAAA